MARKVETLIDLFDFYRRKHSVSCMDNGKRTFKTVQHWQTMNPDKMLEYLDRMIPYFERTKDTFKLNRCKEIEAKIIERKFKGVRKAADSFNRLSVGIKEVRDAN